MKTNTNGRKSSRAEADMEGGDRFRFISVDNPEQMRNASILRAVRQHAMRDIGRSRRRPKDPYLVEFILGDTPTHAEDTQQQVTIPTRSWWLGAGSFDPFLRFPIDLEQHERHLVSISKSYSLVQFCSAVERMIDRV